MLGLLSWQEVLAAGAFTLLFRGAPLAGFAVASPRISVPGKVASVAALGGVVACCAYAYEDALQLLQQVALAWSYLIAAAWAAHALVLELQRRQHTGPALLTLSATIFLLVPALLLRNEATMLLLATGFELTFATYSYWTELVRTRASSQLGGCFSFLLVNPTLVYATRGVDLGKPELSWRAVGRVVVGVLGLFVVPLLSAAISLLVTPMLAPLHDSSQPVVAMAAMALMITLHLIVQYVGHSSLARLQIGVMRLYGYLLPERYDYPFLARSPDDFWRRWNTYLGAWLQRYVFLPLAARHQRRLSQRFWAVGKASALIGAFAVCGVVHEAAGYALRLTMPVGAVLAFVFYGAVLAVWSAGQTALARKLGGRRTLGASWRVAGAFASGSVSIAALMIFGWLALPALSGLGLNQDIVHWVTPEQLGGEQR